MQPFPVLRLLLLRARFARLLDLRAFFACVAEYEDSLTNSQHVSCFACLRDQYLAAEQAVSTLLLLLDCSL